MIRKALMIATVTTAMAVSAPAHAGSKWGGWGGWGGSSSSSSSGGHSHYCGCGHKTCGGSSSSGGSSTSGGSTGGHEVPEPGVLGMLGLGLIGVGVARRRRNRK